MCIHSACSTHTGTTKYNTHAGSYDTNTTITYLMKAVKKYQSVVSHDPALNH
jgi:hypothetical protein